MKSDLLRIIDANLNRSREGLRVCEEISRFVLQDPDSTKKFRNLRHKISRSSRRFPGKMPGLLECRDTQADAGKGALNKTKRNNYKDVFAANIQRVKESLRVLEEFSKIFDSLLGNYFMRLRFRVYELEKKIIARL